jgi:anti-sigma factor ChrR (cupin superfamily)
MSDLVGIGTNQDGQQWKGAHRMPVSVVREQDVGWLSSPALPGIELKVLAGDSESKARSTLARWAPGASFPPHAHPSLEQIYTLEGQCEYDGQVYGPGSSFVFPAGGEHGPFQVGDQGWLTLITFSGLSGFEGVPEFREYLEPLGLV